MLQVGSSVWRAISRWGAQFVRNHNLRGTRNSTTILGAIYNPNAPNEVVGIPSFTIAKPFQRHRWWRWWRRPRGLTVASRYPWLDLICVKLYFANIERLTLVGPRDETDHRIRRGRCDGRNLCRAMGSSKSMRGEMYGCCVYLPWPDLRSGYGK